MEGGGKELIPGMVNRCPGPALMETAISKLHHDRDNTTKQKVFSTRSLIQETTGFGKGPKEGVSSIGSQDKSYSFQ